VLRTKDGLPSSGQVNAYVIAMKLITPAGELLEVTGAIPN
jgi:hypothetical protein